jgi:hypothetical protein
LRAWRAFCTRASLPDAEVIISQRVISITRTKREGGSKVTASLSTVDWVVNLSGQQNKASGPARSLLPGMWETLRSKSARSRSQ